MAERMNGDEFRLMMLKRTRQLAIKVVKLVNEFPSKTAYFVLGNQLVKSSTSVAANYRACLRARSKKEFYAKLCIVVEESDETEFWLEFLIDSELASRTNVEPLRKEAEELLKILSKAKMNSKPS